MLNSWRRIPTPERGATVVEASAYVAVLAVIGVPLIMVTLAVSRASAEGNQLTRIQERNRAVIQRIIEDYRPSLAGTTSVSPDGKVLRFTSLGGFAGAAPLPGPWIRFEIRPDASRGIADEANLVRVDESTREEIILTNSFRSESSFAASGSGVTLTFTLFGDPRDRTLDVKRVITLQPQN